MVSDKEVLMQAAEKYAKGIASNFFGLSSLPVQTAVTYVIRNWVDKHNDMIDLFVDKNGNINTKRKRWIHFGKSQIWRSRCR